MYIYIYGDCELNFSTVENWSFLGYILDEDIINVDISGTWCGKAKLSKRNKDKSQHVRMFAPEFRTVSMNVANTANCLRFNTKVVLVLHSEVSQLLGK